MKDKVDVLLATYNTNIEYLKQQIESILNQTYKDIKLIISDDNSTNEQVKQVLKNYEKKDVRVKLYFQNDNLGYIKNFNFLLQQSDAKYIMFSDHDDIWYENKIEKSLEKIKNENVDLVYCNSHQIDEKGNIIKDSYFKYKNVPLIKGHSKLAISRCIGIGCSQMFTKDIKERIIPFKNQVMAHDWLVAFIANENNGIDYIHEPLFGYRLHNTNVFGGRSFGQNLNKWKERYGNSYNDYLKCRKESIIDKAYLNGAKMCKEYCSNETDKKFIADLIKYYEGLKKSKYINFHIIKYFKFLYGKNLFKKMLKEIISFHFPLLGYIIYRI